MVVMDDGRARLMLVELAWMHSTAMLITDGGVDEGRGVGELGLRVVELEVEVQWNLNFLLCLVLPLMSEIPFRNHQVIELELGLSISKSV